MTPQEILQLPATRTLMQFRQVCSDKCEVSPDFNLLFASSLIAYDAGKPLLFVGGINQNASEVMLAMDVLQNMLGLSEFSIGYDCVNMPLTAEEANMPPEDLLKHLQEREETAETSEDSTESLDIYLIHHVRKKADQPVEVTPLYVPFCLNSDQRFAWQYDPKSDEVAQKSLLPVFVIDYDKLLSRPLHSVLGDAKDELEKMIQEDPQKARESQLHGCISFLVIRGFMVWDFSQPDNPCYYYPDIDDGGEIIGISQSQDPERPRFPLDDWPEIWK